MTDTTRLEPLSIDTVPGIPAGVLLALLAVVGALALGAVEGARALRSALLSITPGGRQ